MNQRPPQKPPALPGLTPIGLLGSGGFSDVFRYLQDDLGREVAVKVLLADLGPAAAQQFRVEANLMAKLSSHPSIVSIFSSGVARDGRAYLVMEMCPTAPLSTRIRQRPYPVPKALEIAIQIAGAIETAHRMGILHRDVKPANILFTDYGRPALTDFGIAGNTTGGGVDAFSVVWAPPEQVVGNPTGPTADVYSLAATTFAMLTGHSPVEIPGGANDTWSITNRVRTETPARTGRPDVPESLERILAIGLAKQPSARFQSPLDFARALQGVQTELRAVVTPIDVMAEDNEEWDEELAAGGTRVTGFVAFDPDTPDAPPPNTIPTGVAGPPREHTMPAPTAAPSAGWMNQGYAPVIEHVGNRPAEPPRQWTTPAIPEVPPEAPAQPEPQRRPQPRNGLRVMLIGAILLLLVGGTALAGQYLTGNVRSTTDNDQGTPSAVPKDPVGRIIPSPTELRLEAAGDKVTVAWTNPDPQEGDTFLYRPQVPGENVPAQRTTETTVTIDAQPGRTCVEVWLARSNGRSSDPSLGCTGG